MVNMFVSYCQKDRVYADNIDLYFKGKNIGVHRDIRDISSWSSIKDYMNTIRDMDYAVLIITDNYLKSFNCMYEVLEVIKEKKYETKIFPVVVETSIYSTEGKIEYIKYWEEKFTNLKEQISKIDIVNAGSILDDLKRTQNICLTISEFLNKVSDMNNPSIHDTNKAIENKLKEKGLLKDDSNLSNTETLRKNEDIFESLNITRINNNNEFTDLQKNKFMARSFSEINELLQELFKEVEKGDNSLNIEVEKIDSRTFIYDFYRNGNKINTLKLTLGNSLFSNTNNITLATGSSYIINNSFNEIIDSKVEDGSLSLYFSLGLRGSQECKTIKEIVAEIWKNYVQVYLNTYSF
ncbi:toll/interleukin-1 receptor domain-containing protein (plasmid) [Clostridium perfringens]|nr:toll/interleukin-1 receptor domain-containing protein [Clostridium perfringens]